MILNTLLYIAIFVLVFVLICFIWGFYYRNIYTLDLYLGKPGSGKSLYSIKLMMKDLKRGWTVYSDDPSNLVPGVKYFDSDAFKRCEWTIPEQSKKKVVLYFDEGGITFPDREYLKNFVNGSLKWWKKHRHHKVKVVLISQSADIDKKLRDMADHYFIVKRCWLPIFVTIIPVNKEVDVVSNAIDKEGKMKAGGNLQDVFTKRGLFFHKHCFMPYYARKYDSFRK